MTSIHRGLLLGVLLAGFALPVAAQQSSTVTQADIQRLQDNVYLADRDVSQARSRDAARATQLQTELDDLRDEVVYLKVKLRKERTLARSEYADVRDRIEDLRSRARGESTAAPTSSSSSAAPAPSRPTTVAPGSLPSPASPASSTRSSTTGAPAGTVEIPVGTEIDVRLQSPLNSGTNQVEDRFEATTLVDVGVNSRVVIPAGSVMRGVVTAVEPATRTNRTARLTVSFDQVTVNGTPYQIRGTVTQAIEGEGIKGETARIGAGAGVGAIIGGILGGFKGALAGILIGGGGTIAATEGKEVQIPQGSVLRVRLDSAAQIASGR
jgi:TolA-binding protein